MQLQNLIATCNLSKVALINSNLLRQVDLVAKITNQLLLC